MPTRPYAERIREALAERSRYRSPNLTGTYTIVAVFVPFFLVASIVAGTDEKIYYQFLEGHSVTALSAAFMAMTSVLAWTCHLKRPLARNDSSRWFWPAMSGAFLFFSLDEILEFHEQLGRWLKHTSLGPSEVFRNWNDAIVIGYGAVAILVIAAFLPEILRYPRLAELLGAGFGFYAIHTAIDSLVSGSIKEIPEESAKLIATALFALAALTAMMTLQIEVPDHRPPADG